MKMITLFVPEKVIEEYENLVARNVIANRSEAFRQGIIEYLAKLKKMFPDDEEIASLVLKTQDGSK